MLANFGKKLYSREVFSVKKGRIRKKGVRKLQAVRSIYGRTKLELEDLIETKINYLIELTYYKIRCKDDYAVEVVKTEHLKNGLKIERKKIDLYTSNETKADSILEILKNNKVTPIGLKDTLIEIVKRI